MKTAKSQKELARARALFPGGVNSPVRAFRAVGGEPLFISRGVPAAVAKLTTVLPFNDLEAVRGFFRSPQGRETACAIVEPVVGNMGVLLPRPGFLETLREETRAAGALLVFDEVMTGFRVARGGAQQKYGIDPDLTCLGKVIGGGLPVGAYGGREDAMAQVAPEGPVYQAGTLSGNPVAMAAGCAMLDLVRQRGFLERIEKRTEELCGQLREACAAAKVPAQVNQVGSMWTIFFASSEVFDYPSAKRSDLKRFAAVHRALLERGVYLPPSQFEAAFLSSEHGTQETLRDARGGVRRFASEEESLQRFEPTQRSGRGDACREPGPERMSEAQRRLVAQVRHARIPTKATTPAAAAARARARRRADISRLRGRASASNRPCAPRSPGSGAKRLSGRPAATGSPVCCASYPLRPR